MVYRRFAYGVAVAAQLLSLQLAVTPLAHARRHVFVGARSSGQGGVPAGDFRDVAVTPDGSQAYTAQGGSVWLFDRDPVRGTLTFVGDQANANNLGQSVRVSPDGSHVYWLGLDLIRGFSRNATTGELTFVNDITVPGLTTSRELAISPDGANLYVTGQHFGTIVVLERNPTTEALSLVETHQDGIAGVDGLAGAWGVAVSPDGTHVYVAGYDDDAVAVFARSAIDGTLTFLGAVTNPLLTLNLVKAIDVSPDGAHVYTGGAGELGVFARDSGSGMLTFVESDTPGFLVVEDLAGGPEGLHVFAADDSGILYAWARDSSTGEVSLEDASPVRLLGYLHEFPNIAVSPDSRNVYVADQQFDDPSSVMIFRRAEVACSEAPLVTCLGLSPFGRSKLLIRDNPDDSGDRLTWKWTDPTPLGPADFGDPIGTFNDYALCLYDASGSPQPLSAPLAPAAVGCDAEEGGATPCWTAVPGVGLKYRQPLRLPDGTTPVKLLTAASGAIKSLFKSKGEHAPVPALPLTLPVTVQLQNAAGGCWEATYGIFISNDAATFKAVAD